MEITFFTIGPSQTNPSAFTPICKTILNKSFLQSVDLEYFHGIKFSKDIFVYFFVF